MMNKKYTGYSVLSTSAVFPERHGKWYDNADLHEIKYGNSWSHELENKGYDPEYFEKKYGFKKRFWVMKPGDSLDGNEPTAVDLIVDSVEEVLEASALNKSDIGMLIVFTTTSPKYTGSAAAVVAGRTGLKCPAFEIKSGCSSAIYSIATAYQFLFSGIENIVIAGGDTLSKLINPESPYFYAAGDGAAALILGKSENKTEGLYASYLDADGQYSEAMGVSGRLPPVERDLEDKKYQFFSRKGIDGVLLEKWKTIPGRLYEKSGFHDADIDLFVPHHSGRHMMEAGRIAAGIPLSKTADYIGDFGNIGPAGLLAALHYSMQENRVKKESVVMLAAAGGGIAWGGVIIKI